MVLKPSQELRGDGEVFAGVGTLTKDVVVAAFDDGLQGLVKHDPSAGVASFAPDGACHPAAHVGVEVTFDALLLRELQVPDLVGSAGGCVAAGCGSVTSQTPPCVHELAEEPDCGDQSKLRGRRDAFDNMAKVASVTETQLMVKDRVLIFGLRQVVAFNDKVGVATSALRVAGMEYGAQLCDSEQANCISSANLQRLGPGRGSPGEGTPSSNPSDTEEHGECVFCPTWCRGGHLQPVRTRAGNAGPGGNFLI